MLLVVLVCLAVAAAWVGERQRLECEANRKKNRQRVTSRQLFDDIKQGPQAARLEENGGSAEHTRYGEEIQQAKASSKATPGGEPDRDRERHPTSRADDTGNQLGKPGATYPSPQGKHRGST